MNGLIEGRIVHYVLPDGPRAGEHRAAIVTDAKGRAPYHLPKPGVVTLSVFTCVGDGATYLEPVCQLCKVPFSETPKPGTWHWIERA